MRWSISRSFSNAWYKYINNISIVRASAEELEALVVDVGVGFSSILAVYVDDDSLYDEDDEAVTSSNKSTVLVTLVDDAVSSPHSHSQLLLLLLRELEEEVVGVGVEVLSVYQELDVVELG